jgi:hypothetical protein
LSVRDDNRARRSVRGVLRNSLAVSGELGDKIVEVIQWATAKG